jgi:hypothetical protein
MKKALFLCTILLISLPATSQGRKYQKGMLKAIEAMNEASDPASAMQSVATFEEFAQEYPDQWMPPYYATQVLVVQCFLESDPDQKDTLLTRAKKSLDKALDLAPEESEVRVLQALYLIGMMSVDPETRGPEYYMDFYYALDKSKDLNPDNPRAKYLEALMALNMPENMGGGPAAAKPIFVEAEQKFDAFQNDDPLWPDWGADLVSDELDRMKDLEQ